MRIVVGILIVLALTGAGWMIADQAYQAGVARGITQSGTAPAPGDPAPGPGVPPYPRYGYPYYGYGYHGPFGFFGFFKVLWTIGLIVLFVALIRGLLWRGPWSGHWGGRGVPSAFEEWHRRAHERGEGGTV